MENIPLSLPDTTAAYTKCRDSLMDILGTVGDPDTLRVIAADLEVHYGHTPDVDYLGDIADAIEAAMNKFVGR
jgi:hypothetical protein